MSSINDRFLDRIGLVRKINSNGRLLINYIDPEAFSPESLVRHVSLFEEQASFVHVGTEITFTLHPYDPFNKILGRVCYLRSPNKYINILTSTEEPSEHAPYEFTAQYRALLAAVNPSYWERTQEITDCWRKEGF